MQDVWLPAVLTTIETQVPPAASSGSTSDFQSMTAAFGEWTTLSRGAVVNALLGFDNDGKMRLFDGGNVFLFDFDSHRPTRPKIRFDEENGQKELVRAYLFVDRKALSEALDSLQARGYRIVHHALKPEQIT